MSLLIKALNVPPLTTTVQTYVRDEVLKEVGLTSTAFIGPAFPPETSPAKCDMDDALSKFYEELEKIDPPDLNQTESNPEKDDGPSQPPELSASKETQDEPEGKLHITKTSSETSSYQSKQEQTNISWRHWYRNEPYQLKQRPTPNQCPYPPFSNRPAYPRFVPPALPHRLHSSACPKSRNLPLYIDNAFNDARMTNQSYNDFNLPALPPPHTCLHPSQGFYGNPPQHLGWSDADSDHRTAGWSGDRREEWSWHDENYVYERLPQRPNQLRDNTNTFHSSLVLILMRGLPGSGKSTLSRELLSTGPSGVILSTDDYFTQKNGCRYDVRLLGAAHEWNQSRAKDAIQGGRSPVIIDNTNLQAWEMKPYVKMALERGYRVDFCEPDTSWKFDPYELEKRNKHGVCHEKIIQMMDRFSALVSVDIVMNSQEPAHVKESRRAEQPHIRKT